MWRAHPNVARHAGTRIIGVVNHAFSSLFCGGGKRGDHGSVSSRAGSVLDSAAEHLRNHKHSPMPNGLVFEHGAKRAPARIEDGLRHLRAGQGRAVHVTNTDQGVLPNDAGGLFMQEVPPLGRDLPVYLARLRLSARPLGASEFRRRLADVTRVRDLRSRGQGREVFQAEINADLPGSSRKIVRNFTDKVKIPTPFGILTETTRADVGRDRTREPEPVFLPEKSDGIAVDLERSVALERHPPQGPFRTTAGTPARTPLCFVPADGELFAHGLNGIAVQSEFLAASAGQLDQIEPARPAPVQS